MKIDFGGVLEDVNTKEFPILRQKVLKNETIAVIGYGARSCARAEHADNGFNVIVAPGKRVQARLGPSREGRLEARGESFSITSLPARHHHPTVGERRCTKENLRQQSRNI